MISVMSHSYSHSQLPLAVMMSRNSFGACSYVAMLKKTPTSANVSILKAKQLSELY